MQRVIIVGAGLAGLTCAKLLQEQWGSTVELVVLERDPSPGGRVQTDVYEGFHLDRGFQVLFTAYPSVQRQVQLAALNPCSYRPGAMLVRDGQSYLLGDPLRDLSALLPSLANPLASLGDKLRVLGLRAQLLGKSYDQIRAEPELTTADYLTNYGFSPAIQEHFFRPFYRGILLDPTLETSSHLFQFYFQMLSQGSIVTPTLGMGEITQQLAGHLPPHILRCQCPVEDLWLEGNRVKGVHLEDGTGIPADWVVWATDAPTVQQRLHLATPTQARSVTTLYFASEYPLTAGAYLYLNAQGSGLINHCMEVTQVSPALAPAGQHLLSVTVLGTPSLTDEALVKRCHSELQQWFPSVKEGSLRYLRLYRIPFAQFAQPVGGQAQLSQTHTALEGLVLAGEYTCQSSIEGAIVSGERAAAILRTAITP